MVALVGDTIDVEVWVDLGALRASGVTLHVRLPAASLAAVGAPDAQVRPFRARGLFAGAVEFANHVVPPEQAVGVPEDSALMSWAAVLGPGSVGERSRSGAGPVAVFRAVCAAPLDGGEIRLFSNPVFESQVVLADGRSQRRLRASGVVRVTVLEPATKGLAGSWAAVKSRHAAD